LALIGVITALQTEANSLGLLADEKDVLTIVSGIGAEAATRSASSLCQHGCSGLISFGYAGALNSSYKTGTLLVGNSVSNGHTTIDLGSHWLNKFTDAVREECQLPFHLTPILTSAFPLINKYQKTTQTTKGHWGAVDMESYPIAQVASKYRIPTLIVRAILDELDTDIPESAMRMIDLNGKQKVLPTIYQIAKKPYHLVRYFQLAKARKKANETLGRVAPIVGRSRPP